ncbi:MAG TPA: SGNH/GDSL hydrolase family protein, partial [Edaphobacter sp.]|nr:SGNH/GDSL hydrolase family protein [Edaphobacter sp.]
TANPGWTTQGIKCDGTSQYFNAPGTRTARTFVWASTLAPQLNSAIPAGVQFVTPFSVPDLSVTFGGNGYYGHHPGVASGGTYFDLSNDTLQGTHTYALTLGTNTSTDPNVFYVDGVPTSYLSARWMAAGIATGNYQVCGSNTGFPTYFGGNFYYFEAFSDEKTPAQIQQEAAAVTQMVKSRGVAYSVVPSPTIKNLYIAAGDSLTNGEGVNPSSQYITPTDTFDVVNYGLGNSDSDDAFEFFDAREAPLYRHNAGRNVIRLWVGTNDVSTRGRTTQQALDGIRAYCGKAKAAGFQTIVSDMISRTGHDTNMQALDGLLTSQDTGCDLVLDLASNPLLGAVGAYSNTAYYQIDAIHLNQAGQQNLVAPAETRAINLLSHLKGSNTSPTVTTPTYTMADYDLYLPVSPSANSVAVTLPDCNYFTGMTRSIKNVQGTGTNAVTVAPAAGQLIEGSGSAVTVANGATLVLRQMVLNRTTAGCSWMKVGNN